MFNISQYKYSNVLPHLSAFGARIMFQRVSESFPTLGFALIHRDGGHVLVTDERLDEGMKGVVQDAYDYAMMVQKSVG